MFLFALIAVFIFIAVVLAWFLITHDHGEREPVGALWVAAGLGLLGAGLASVVEGLLISAPAVQPAAAAGTLVVACIIIGVVEELCKFGPLALWVYRKRYFNEHTDGVIYFALAGLGFGLPENILYTLQFGAKAGIARVVLTPFFHAAITAVVGYALVRQKLTRKSPLGALAPLAGAMLLHALYDFGLISTKPLFTAISLLITLSLSAGLFVLYVRATELDQDRGLSTVGHNNFCRTCGASNPRHHLYCTACGKIA